MALKSRPGRIEPRRHSVEAADQTTDMVAAQPESNMRTPGAVLGHSERLVSRRPGAGGRAGDDCDGSRPETNMRAPGRLGANPGVSVDRSSSDNWRVALGSPAR